MLSEKTIEKVKSLSPGTYTVYSDEIAQLYEINGKDWVNSTYDAFRYGFLKGQRAAKAAAKAAAKKKAVQA